MTTQDQNPGYENPNQSWNGDNDYRNRMTGRYDDDKDEENEDEDSEDEDSEIEEKHSEWGDVDPQHNGNNFPSGNEPSGPGSAV